MPRALEEGSLALGVTRWQTITGVILPAAAPGILTSIILAMARAFGETMAVQMVIGNSPQIARSLFMPTATLTSEIVVEMGNTPFGSVWGNSLFLMALRPAGRWGNRPSSSSPPTQPYRGSCRTLTSWRREKRSRSICGMS